MLLSYDIYLTINLKYYYMQNKQDWISQIIQIIRFLKVCKKTFEDALLTYIYGLLYAIKLYESTAKAKLCQYLADIHMQVYRKKGREELTQKYKKYFEPRV